MPVNRLDRVSQSLPNQVNDFNRFTPRPRPTPVPRCRNPFQTRSTTSISGRKTLGEILSKMSQSLPNQVNDFNQREKSTKSQLPKCRNPFQTRSTTSMLVKAIDVDETSLSRNPFQTRSTTSILLDRENGLGGDPVAIPSKPGQRLQ